MRARSTAVSTSQGTCELSFLKAYPSQNPGIFFDHLFPSKPFLVQFPPLLTPSDKLLRVIEELANEIGKPLAGRNIPTTFGLNDQAGDIGIWCHESDQRPGSGEKGVGPGENGESLQPGLEGNEAGIRSSQKLDKAILRLKGKKVHSAKLFLVHPSYQMPTFRAISHEKEADRQSLKQSSSIQNGIERMHAAHIAGIEQQQFFVIDIQLFANGLIA